MGKSSTSFKPGNDFGKRSKRKKDPIREAIKEQSITDIHEIWKKVSGMSPAEMSKHLERIEKESNSGTKQAGSKLTAMEALFVSSMVRGIKTGDFSRVSGILDRIIGKPAVKITHEIEDEISQEDLQRLDDIFNEFQNKKKGKLK